MGAPVKNEPGSTSVASRDAFGDALVRLGETHPELVVLEADLSESTRSKKFGGIRIRAGLLGERSMPTPDAPRRSASTVRSKAPEPTPQSSTRRGPGQASRAAATVVSLSMRGMSTPGDTRNTRP